LARNPYLEVEHYIGTLGELEIRRERKPRDPGEGTMGDKHRGHIRLVSVFDREAVEPWFLVTNMMDEGPKRIVRRYKRRMWIEAMLRDLKNRDWGLGMDQAKLTKHSRIDRHFLVIALACTFLVAFEAAAETTGLGKQLKANTVEKLVLPLARIGNYFPKSARLAIPIAITALLELPT